jgi:hypothetical protein
LFEDHDTQRSAVAVPQLDLRQRTAIGFFIGLGMFAAIPLHADGPENVVPVPSPPYRACCCW